MLESEKDLRMNQYLKYILINLLTIIVYVVIINECNIIKQDINEENLRQ